MQDRKVVLSRRFFVTTIWTSIASGAAINIGLPLMSLLTKPPDFVIAFRHIKRWRFLVTLMLLVSKFGILSN